jgi:uncharacterized protein DUF2357
MGSPRSELDRLQPLRTAVRGTSTELGLGAILPRLQRAHRKDLVRRERWTQGDLARHPEPRELIRSVRRPGNMDEHRRLIRVYDARRTLTEDVHENRVVRHVVIEVRARLARLSAAGEPEATGLLHELDAAVANAPFLRSVGELDARPTVPTATLSGDPLYRRVFRTWLELERPPQTGQ